MTPRTVLKLGNALGYIAYLIGGMAVVMMLAALPTGRRVQAQAPQPQRFTQESVSVLDTRTKILVLRDSFAGRCYLLAEGRDDQNATTPSVSFTPFTVPCASSK
jgi:hypothetical protein